MRGRYDQDDVARLIEQLVTAIAARFPAEEPLNIVGIRTRGETLADRIAASLARRGYRKLGRGVLDVTLYRDDLSAKGPLPLVRPTELADPIDGSPLLLVDDVLFTGRSVRAALAALVDFGRPAVIRLAVLVDRPGRELPIQPDFVALPLSNIPASQRVNVRFAEVDGSDEILIEPAGGKAAT